MISSNLIAAAKELFEVEEIDIIAMAHEQYYLPKIAYKTVYDIAILMHDRSFKGGEMRLRGLNFVELTKEQEDKLDIMLDRCYARGGK